MTNFQVVTEISVSGAPNDMNRFTVLINYLMMIFPIHIAEAGI